MTAEMHSDADVNSGGIAVQLRRFVFPLLDGLQGRPMEQSRTGDDFDGRDSAVRVNEGVDLDLTGDVLGSGGGRVDGSNRLDQNGLLEVSADRKRSCGFFAISSGQSGEGILTGRWGDINGRLGFIARQRFTGAIDNRSGEVDFTESRLLGLLDGRSIALRRLGIPGGGGRSCRRESWSGVRNRLAVNYG